MNAPRRRVRKNPRLVSSGYVASEPEKSTEVWAARLALMDSVAEICPRFLEELGTEVLPLFREMKKAGYDFDWILYGRGTPYHKLPADSGLRQALHKWAKRFRADEDWLLNDALLTLHSWCFSRTLRKHRRWRSLHSGSPSGAMGEVFSFSCSGWELEAITWGEYKKFVHGIVDQRLSNYKRDIPNLAVTHQLVPARHKYEQANLDWFVLFQFRGLSIREIVDQVSKIRSSGVEESRIQKGIKAAGRLLAWSWARIRKIRPNDQCS